MSAAHPVWTTPAALPSFLRPLARHAAVGDAVLGRALQEAPRDWTPRRSAVLVLIAGQEVEDAQILLEERSHTMRSQPAQFALPGGRAEPEDADDAATALREAREETGLDPADVHVLGAFAPIPMPFRDATVSPVLAWAPRPPALGPTDPAEVESLLWAPLAGAGSLTDPAIHRIGVLDGRATGVAFDLPGDAFVWGFTAMILDAVLGGLELPGMPVVAAVAPRVEVPAVRRRPGPGARR